jgi:hypothetical protein
MPVAAVQTRYRFRSDAATVDAAPTWAANENTTYFPGLSTNFRLRFEVQNTGSTSTGAQTWNLFFSRNASAYAQVSVSSSYVQSVAASVDADNTALTVRRLTADAGTFVNGQYDSTGATGTITLAGSSVSELEFGLVLSGTFVSGDTLDFRVYRGGSTALNTYTQIPRVTVTVTTLGANPLTVASPAIGAPTIGYNYSLSVSGDLVVASPNLSAAPAFTAFTTTTYNIGASSPIIGSPKLSAAPPFALWTGGGGINFGTPPALTDSSPYYTTPDFAAGGVSVSGVNLTVGSPAFGSPSIGALIAQGCSVGSPKQSTAPAFVIFGGPVILPTPPTFSDSSPYYTTPDFSPGIGASDVIVASPIIGAPTFAQKQAFASVGFVVGSPAIGTPAAQQAQVISAASMAVGSPLFSVPAVATASGIVAVPIAVGSLVIGTPTLTQLQVLNSIGFAVASPAIGNAAVSISINFNAIGITVGSPPLGSPTLAQKQVLSATSIAVGSPQFSAAVLTFSGQVTAVPLTVGSPIIGAPTFAQKQVLAATSLTVASPAIAAASLASVYPFVATPLTTASPTIGTSAINQNHHFATSLTVGSPIIGTPALAQKQSLLASSLATALPALGTPLVVGAGVIAAVNFVTSPPVIGAPNLGQKQVLTSVGITVGVPFFGPVVVALPNQIVAVPVPVVDGSPAFGIPTIAQIHVLLPSSLAVGSPQFLAPTAGSINMASASNLAVSSPVLGAPQLVMLTGFSPVLDLVVSSPIISVATINQVQAISVLNVAIGRPSIDAAAITAQLQYLTATDLTTGSPAFGAAVAVGQGQVGAVPLILGSPIIGAASVGQNQHVSNLTGEMAVGRPYLQPPILTQFNKLTGANLVVASPQCGAPTCTQILVNHLVAQNLIVVSPDIAPLVPDVTTDVNRLFADYFYGDQAAPPDLTGQAFNTDTII